MEPAELVVVITPAPPPTALEPEALEPTVVVPLAAVEVTVALAPLEPEPAARATARKG